MSWMIPYNKLGPDQREFIDRFTSQKNQNFWIKGFAGSGKSVVLLSCLIQAKRDNPNLSVCLVLFTHSLIDLFRTGIPKEIAQISIFTYHQFSKHNFNYDLIFVDEVQDLPSTTLELLRQRCKRLIVAGDEAQSIYDDRVQLEEIKELAAAEPFPLTFLYRLTNKIIKIAQIIFPDKRLNEAKRTRMQNVDVVLATAKTQDEEIKYVWKNASQYATPNRPVAILLPRHKQIIYFANTVLLQNNYQAWDAPENQWGNPDYSSLNKKLINSNLCLRYLGNNNDGGSLKDSETEPIVYLMTYHSSKGLDFETVFLPMFNQNFPLDGSEKDRTLLFVAITRARLNLFFTYTGTPHRYINKINQEDESVFSKIDIDFSQQNNQSDLIDDDEIIF